MIPFFPLIVISVICFIAQFEPITSWLVWNRALMTSPGHYEWWRIITGNFTHTNWPHYAMNIIALWLIACIFKPTTRSLSLALLIISAWVGLSLLYISHLNEYLGLSGVLHGLFAYWALTEALHQRRTSWLLVLGVVAKVSWEQTYGPSPLTQTLIEAHVATGAHLSGMIAGFLMAIGQTWYRSSHAHQ